MSCEAQSEGRNNQTVNIHPTKNPQFAHFHKGPKLNFILFVYYSPRSHIFASQKSLT